jgi:Leucine-rich repeat (LRR) protein
MKLTPELIEQAHSYLSPLKDREVGAPRRSLAAALLTLACSSTCAASRSQPSTTSVSHECVGHSSSECRPTADRPSLQDQHDSIDLTDNDIRSLTNLPSLPRLTTLILSNNAIASIAPRIANAAPRLTTLVLTNNRIESLAALQPLARFPCLEYLSLLGNGVARKEHYREWVISRCPKVRVLDFRRVKEKVSAAWGRER